MIDFWRVWSRIVQCPAFEAEANALAQVKSLRLAGVELVAGFYPGPSALLARVIATEIERYLLEEMCLRLKLVIVDVDPS